MKRLLCFFIMGTALACLFGESPDSYKVNYNRYYRSPVSLGFGYSALSPLNGYDTGAPYKISDLSLGIQYSPRPLPTLQPELTLGYRISDSQNSLDADLWDSNGYYATGGFRFIHRFSKSFEAGIGLSGGYERTLFSGLSTDGMVSTGFALGQTALYLGLNPSYNMNLTLVPSLRYQHCLDSYHTDMNGFLFGIGGVVSFRFGKDPDSPDAVIKSLNFTNAEIEPLFASMQSYYTKNPFGSVTVTNTDKNDFHNVVFTFFQSGYMDAPTIIQELDVIESGETVTVPLKASFNNEVFMTEGVTPLSGEVRVSYAYNRRPVDQAYPVSYDLYDKSSMLWDDDRKVAAFITPADSALQNYSSFIRHSCKEDVNRGHNAQLQSAMQIYHALAEIGVIYQADPLQPFASVSDTEALTVDTVNLPRNTLKKLTGDCDDLTVLYLSLLETLGIETAFLTVPGHIYTAFNTKEAAPTAVRIHPDRDMTINIDGELWVPVEITLIGKTDFMDAWQKGAEQWNSLEDRVDQRSMYLTAEARKEFRPVGLRETDLGLQYGDAPQIASAFSRDLDDLTEIILADYYRKAEERGSKQDYNRLGIVLAEYGRNSEAISAFNKAVRKDSSYMSPRVNMANLEYLAGRYDKAVDAYLSVLELLGEKGKDASRSAALINLNLSRSYYAMKNTEAAQKYFSAAEAIDPERAAEASYLAAVSSGNGISRASEAAETTVFFMDEE
ncbi:MAG: tetratricopeptide repeat protein [Spirochaetales bacterium]|nr:tetratricopeptide repeat protein [Spirochaetales bacterium]